jgi:cysteinyl-tRNA synthetase
VPLALYNTLTRRKEPFEPLDARNVRMYVCGPTVYDFAHIGNARPVIVFDVLYRLLRHLYGAEHVRYVRNITDIDDRIIAAAKENREGIDALTQRTAQVFQEDAAALGALRPDVEPRATKHLAPMIAMIERLIAAGHAYVAEGHVLFAVSSMPDYGKLSRRSRDEMIAGARVEIAPYKRDPADFVLWKPSTPDQPGWESPWGRGRPGWHIECSAMSETYLGETFDIHGGGLDLIFPHHENEIAQSVCSHRGAPFARYWLHNAFVIVEGAKMSKSLGNFRTIRDVLQETWPEVARAAMLLTHYRDPLNWTTERVHEAHNLLVRFHIALRDSPDIGDCLEEPDSEVIGALEDDLNTPAALRVIGDRVSALHSETDETKKRQLKTTIQASARLLGLLTYEPAAWLKNSVPVFLSAKSMAMSGVRATPTMVVVDHPMSSEFESEGSDRWINSKVVERADARKRRDFAAADRIRTELAMKGIILEDRPDGTTEWRRGN